MSLKVAIGICRSIPLKGQEKISELKLDKKVRAHCEGWWIAEEGKALYKGRMMLSYETDTGGS